MPKIFVKFLGRFRLSIGKDGLPAVLLLCRAAEVVCYVSVAHCRFSDNGCRLTFWSCWSANVVCRMSALTANRQTSSDDWQSPVADCQESSVYCADGLRIGKWCLLTGGIALLIVRRRLRTGSQVPRTGGFSLMTSNW